MAMSLFEEIWVFIHCFACVSDLSFDSLSCRSIVWKLLDHSNIFRTKFTILSCFGACMTQVKVTLSHQGKEYVQKFVSAPYVQNRSAYFEIYCILQTSLVCYRYLANDVMKQQELCYMWVYLDIYKYSFVILILYYSVPSTL